MKLINWKRLTAFAAVYVLIKGTEKIRKVIKVYQNGSC